MKRTISSLLLAVVLPLGASAAVLATTTPADAQYYYRPSPPAYTYYSRYRPVYYNGYAHYWYNNYWYYRDGYGRWQYYEHAPRELCTYRRDWYGDVRAVCD